jgi:hypothetical protein
MRKFRIVLTASAFVFALAGALASDLLQNAYFDNNGSAPGGAQQATITDPIEGVCSTNNTGAACLIGTQWAFDTGEHAVANAGAKVGNPTGLMKRVP